MDFKEGQIVTGIYKTGKYIGEITMIRPPAYVVRVLAVVKHPRQGDLHNPNKADVSIFHERRALAYREQVNIPKAYVEAFDKSVPVYEDSLKEALKEEIATLEKEQSEYAKKSLEILKSLDSDYFNRPL